MAVGVLGSASLTIGAFQTASTTVYTCPLVGISYSVVHVYGNGSNTNSSGLPTSGAYSVRAGGGILRGASYPASSTTTTVASLDVSASVILAPGQSITLNQSAGSAGGTSLGTLSATVTGYEVP